MRVCYVAATVRPTDGWGRYARELVAAAPAAGIEPVLVTARRDGGEPAAAVERYPVLPPLLAGRCELVRSLLRAPALRRIARSCEVVHCLVEPWLPLAALAVPANMPLVQTAHGSWAVHPLRRPLVRHVFARALARTDLLICQSRVTRDAVAALATPPRSEVLAGGVDPEAYIGPVGPPPPGWPVQGRVVLSVGALKPRKGHEIALEAIAGLASSHPELRLVVVSGRTGRSLHADALRRRAAALGIGDRVHWLAELSDAELVACYRRAALFLLLPVAHGGSFEGLGLVFLEAAAAGIPAVGTLGSGAVDAVAEGVTGLLVPPGDAPAAAAAIDRLLRDPALAERLGRAAQAAARRRSWSNLAQALAGRYRDLVERRAVIRGGAP